MCGIDEHQNAHNAEMHRRKVAAADKSTRLKRKRKRKTNKQKKNINPENKNPINESAHNKQK
jgi:hypothetical protein